MIWNSKNERPSVLTFKVLTKELTEKIDESILKNDADPSRLVGILLQVQDMIPKQYIPIEVAAYIGEKLKIPFSRVYDVISFYAALSSVPRADYIIQICDSVVCNVVGNKFLKTTLESLLNISVGEVTSDGKFALALTPCFGACDIAPAIRLNGKVYGHLTCTEKIKELIDACKDNQLT